MLLACLDDDEMVPLQPWIQQLGRVIEQHTVIYLYMLYCLLTLLELWVEQLLSLKTMNLESQMAILDVSAYVSLYANPLGKGMNPSLSLPPDFCKIVEQTGLSGLGREIIVIKKNFFNYNCIVSENQ